MSPRAYITTPIYYVNDRPHIGHAYTTTICDIYTRFMRFAGRDVFFLTGTDEHGAKVEESARARAISPQELADENAAEFQRVMATLDLGYDDFIRTSEPRHCRQVEFFVKRLLDAGAVYMGEFEGWYDEGQVSTFSEVFNRSIATAPFSASITSKPRSLSIFPRISRMALESSITIARTLNPP